ncbi:MAG: hypothetical protein S4CHLAM45_13900 [Chlamydiales bacterium]|nr:hypothetical protein [Chlamydiales bacterium]MCH9620495.1 hypothetical protein [Chlamydiales bacterium]MCH9623480.1 hypothetical protein [Chlamydiales bacterium]
MSTTSSTGPDFRLSPEPSPAAVSPTKTSTTYSTAAITVVALAAIALLAGALVTYFNAYGMAPWAFPMSPGGLITLAVGGTVLAITAAAMLYLRNSYTSTELKETQDRLDETTKALNVCAALDVSAPDVVVSRQQVLSWLLYLNKGQFALLQCNNALHIGYLDQQDRGAIATIEQAAPFLSAIPPSEVNSKTRKIPLEKLKTLSQQEAKADLTLLSPLAPFLFNGELTARFRDGEEGTVVIAHLTGSGSKALLTLRKKDGNVEHSRCINEAEGEEYDLSQLKMMGPDAAVAVKKRDGSLQVDTLDGEEVKTLTDENEMKEALMNSPLIKGDIVKSTGFVNVS